MAILLTPMNVAHTRENLINFRVKKHPLTSGPIKRKKEGYIDDDDDDHDDSDYEPVDPKKR